MLEVALIETPEARIRRLERAIFPQEHCDHEWRTEMIPCPDNKPGCLVLHYGTVCAKCGARR